MANIKHEPFTDDQIRYIRERHTEASARQIAEALGLDPTRVKNYIYQMRVREGLTYRRREPWSAEDVTRMRDMAADGKSVAEIAEAFGRCYHTMHTVLWRYRIKVPRSKPRTSPVAKPQTAKALRRASGPSRTRRPDAEAGYYKRPSQLKRELSRKRSLTPLEQYQLMICRHATEPYYTEHQCKNI